jgi:hypothetical protein
MEEKLQDVELYAEQGPPQGVCGPGLRSKVTHAGTPE